MTTRVDTRDANRHRVTVWECVCVWGGGGGGGGGGERLSYTLSGENVDG